MPLRTSEPLCSNRSHVARTVERQPGRSYARLPFEFVGSFLMLSGFALANMLKGLRDYQMRKANESAVVDGKLNPKLKTHNLFVLADATGILPLVAGWEIELLSRLTQMVRWAGRYPVDAGHGTARQPGMLTELAPPTIEKFVTHIRAAEREFWVRSERRRMLVGHRQCVDLRRRFPPTPHFIREFRGI